MKNKNKRKRLTAKKLLQMSEKELEEMQRQTTKIKKTGEIVLINRKWRKIYY